MSSGLRFATEKEVEIMNARAERCGNAPDSLSMDTNCMPKSTDFDVFLNDELQDMRNLRYADSAAGVVILYETHGGEKVGNAPVRVVDYERGCLMMRVIVWKVEIRERKV